MNYKTWLLTCSLATLPFLQVMPDLEYLRGLEEIGIVGFLSAVMIWLVWERHFFMQKTTTQITSMEKRMTSLEMNIANGDERIINLLNAQLDTLKEIKAGQIENFTRMWTLAMGNQPREKNNELTNSNG